LKYQRKHPPKKYSIRLVPAPKDGATWTKEKNFSSKREAYKRAKFYLLNGYQEVLIYKHGQFVEKINLPPNSITFIERLPNE